MLHGLFAASLIGSGVEIIKEANQKTIPAEYWANKDLYYKDLMAGVSVEQRMKNLENGKYKLTETYPEPHRGADGRIVIENNLLYQEDLKNFGAHQTMKWVKQGKYNLTPEELKKEHERIKAEFDYLFNLL